MNLRSLNSVREADEDMHPFPVAPENAGSRCNRMRLLEQTFQCVEILPHTTATTGYLSETAYNASEDSRPLGLLFTDYLQTHSNTESQVSADGLWTYSTWT